MINNETLEVNVIPQFKVYYNEKSNYGIYSCKTLDDVNLTLDPIYKTFSIKGETFKLELSKQYLMNIIEREDKSKFGNYYEILSIYENIPEDREEQYSFLKAILTKAQVNNLYKAYPEGNIVDMIRNDQIDYNKVKGLGAITYNKLKARIDNNISFQEAFRFFKDIESITEQQIIKLVKHYRSSGLLITKFKNDPYCIMDVSGIGFLTADKIALEYGYSSTGSCRIKAAIRFRVEEETNEGHTYSNRSSIVDQVVELVKEEVSIVNGFIDECEELVLVDGDKLALKNIYNAEKFIASKFKELINRKVNLNIDVDKFVKEEEKAKGINFTDKQLEILHKVNTSALNILGGYSGSGKSSTVNTLLNMLSASGITYKLVSPTGKAAKILTNYTGRDAETIHRAAGIGLSKDAFAEKEITDEYLIIDECSMVDVKLCATLLNKCTHKDLKVLVIGDPAQISSIGAGQLLYDSITSNVIPKVILDKVFRQSEGGAIDIITKIRQNEKFVKSNDMGMFKFGDDCELALVPQEKIEGGYKYFYKKFLDTYEPEEITVITSMNKNNLGTIKINNELQKIVNPKSNDKKELTIKTLEGNFTTYREGDIVLNTVNGLMINNEDRSVMIVNGDIGKVVDVDAKEKIVSVEFDNMIIPYALNQLKQLQHAWCMTTFKMQGSGAKAVIVIADKSHKRMLNNGLLYTASSRVTDELVILGQAETINYAMNKDDTKIRRTFLKRMLQEIISEDE